MWRFPQTSAIAKANKILRRAAAQPNLKPGDANCKCEVEADGIKLALAVLVVAADLAVFGWDVVCAAGGLVLAVGAGAVLAGAV